jgi:hypothetical protein
MKTLIYTCIYNGLWGTTFGGRYGREGHYLYSLKNILNLNADKFICFTSSEEIDKLREWFYKTNGISEEKIQFIEFNLSDTTFFKEISDNKDLEEIKNSDRCVEIQYNKFFWLKKIEFLSDYDKVYWFDAGLSHSGIFIEKYAEGEGYERYFKYNLFNSDYLSFLNEYTNDKLVLVSKNNSGNFYWSATLPEKYYETYNNSEHIIGGFFGGNVKDMINFSNQFEILIYQVLLNEKILYPEECLMSCIYFNNKNNFITLSFDDWYDRKNPEAYGNNVKYFYNIFEK